jgi:hypothetical protein
LILRPVVILVQDPKFARVEAKGKANVSPTALPALTGDTE